MAQLTERLTGDKLVASFGATFGRDHDNDNEAADKDLAEEITANPPDMSGTQFEFSAEQV